MSMRFGPSLGGIGSSPLAPTDPARLEEELAVALRKALAPDDSAPKQKHVRAAILYTWDVRGAGSFWTAIKTFPLLADDIVVFKALVLIHKVVRQGHPSVLRAGIAETAWLDQLARSVTGGYAASAPRLGYGTIISAYVAYLLSKFQFHATHPEFSGTFDYEEYVSLKGIEDPNEGYETINDLLILLDRAESFSKIIFASLRNTGLSEARVSALVPLVEETHGIYQFIISMMTAMHQIIGSTEVLAPLRDKFKQTHYALYRFYDECLGIKYLTALISIPKISAEPIDFLGNGVPTQQPRNKKKEDDEIARRIREEEELTRKFMEEQESLERQRQLQEDLDRQRQQQEYERQQELLRQQELMRQQELLRQQEQERLRLQLQAQQEQQMVQSRLMDAHSQVEYFRAQAARDRSTIEQYNQRVGHLEQQLAQMSLTNAAQGDKDTTIKTLRDEVSQWKQKYEALAKLYAQLRKEHLDLLNKFKQIKDDGNKVSDEARRETEAVRSELKAKTQELTETMIERNRLKSDTDRIRLQYETEISRLQQEISDSKSALQELSASKGSQVQSIVARFTADQDRLESLIRSKQAESESLRQRIDDLLVTLDRNKTTHDEEVTVLQASLDQALQVLAQHQHQTTTGIQSRDTEITHLRNTHRKLLYDMMDNVLQTCITTVTDTLFDLDSTATTTTTTMTGHDMTVSSSPEYVLTLIEKTQQTCTDLCTAFTKLVSGGDTRDAIYMSTSLSRCITQLIQSGKLVTQLCETDTDAHGLVTLLRVSGESVIRYFESLKSGSLALIDPSTQSTHIASQCRDTQTTVGRIIAVMDTLTTTKLRDTKDTDLGDMVDRELTRAAQMIEEASQRMQDLIIKHSQSNHPDLNVHAAILQSAMAITTAISNLIRCATACQAEIVMHGKDTGIGRTAFYKKHNKWTEGLISAAYAVADATVTLVSYADGLITGTRSWEQLVVSAQHVSVCTTQLVAASRVKSVPFSKTQSKLEDAAKSVRHATDLLVKAAKDAAKVSAEQQARDDVMKMSKHEAKVKEMEQQVKILELEKELGMARYRLGEMRKQGYHEEES